MTSYFWSGFPSLSDYPRDVWTAYWQSYPLTISPLSLELTLHYPTFIRHLTKFNCSSNHIFSVIFEVLLLNILKTDVKSFTISDLHGNVENTKILFQTKKNNK